LVVLQAELELPDYHELNGGEDAAGPPDFFRGETSKWGAVTDLDDFFQRVYQYYCDKGFWCIFTRWLCELLILGFTIGFSGFLVLKVNWPGLLRAKCGIDAIDAGNRHNCNLAKEGLHEHPLTPFTTFKAFFVTYLVLLSLYWLFCFLRFFTQLHDTLEVRIFIHNRCETPLPRRCIRSAFQFRHLFGLAATSTSFGFFQQFVTIQSLDSPDLDMLIDNVVLLQSCCFRG
jgi:hypothetical protein